MITISDVIIIIPSKLTESAVLDDVVIDFVHDLVHELTHRLHNVNARVTQWQGVLYHMHTHTYINQSCQFQQK